MSRASSEIRQEIEQGRFPFRTELEDIHMHIERALIDRLGDVGRKLHTARSRNDQVATDLRLWVRWAIDQIDRPLGGVAAGIRRPMRRRRRRDPARLHPFPTGAAGAGPALLAGVLREVPARPAAAGRLPPPGERVCRWAPPRLAGTSLPIDRARRCRPAWVRRRGGQQPRRRRATATSPWSSPSSLALVAEHLSTWAEEWILWSTVEFNFIKLPQAFCTGSSIMPQKINPDVLELIRGKTARVVGNLQTLLVLVKGLPLAYNRDLQEDKPPLFDSFDTVRASLELAAPLVAGAELNRAAIAERLDRGHLDATTLMEHLIRRGVPQRTAHGLVGRLVRKALDRGVRLADLSLEEFREAHPGPGCERLRRARSRKGRGRDDQLRLDRAGASERASSAMEGTAARKIHGIEQR